MLAESTATAPDRLSNESLRIIRKRMGLCIGYGLFGHGIGDRRSIRVDVLDSSASSAFYGQETHSELLTRMYTAAVRPASDVGYITLERRF